LPKWRKIGRFVSDNRFRQSFQPGVHLMKIYRILIVGALAVTLAACQNSQYGQKQTGGAVLGGIAGGLLGSQVGGGKGKLAATAAGALLGVFLGSEIGKSLDKADRLYAARTTQSSLETTRTGSTSSWSNPDSGHSGSVTPTRTYQSARGENCREYQQTVTIGGRQETAVGRACRQTDGSWRIVN
jgi:surface antigen